jgi:hypothetical protein
MKTLYLLTIIGAAIGLAIGYYVSLSGHWVGPCCWIVGIAIGAGVGCFIGTCVANSILVPTHDVVSRDVKLVSMRSSDGGIGTFVWGSSDGSYPTYHFFMQNDDGSFTPGQVPANSLVRIIEDKDLDGVGYWRTIARQADLSSPIASWALDPQDCNFVITQEFRVPVGTVVQSFSVK